MPGPVSAIAEQTVEGPNGVVSCSTVANNESPAKTMEPRSIKPSTTKTTEAPIENGETASKSAGENPEATKTISIPPHDQVEHK